MERQIKCLNWSTILEEKIEFQKFPQINPDDIFTFSYTSGTTCKQFHKYLDIFIISIRFATNILFFYTIYLLATPKCAMISHRNMVTVINGSNYCDVQLYFDDVHLSYLPLPHIYERVVTYTALSVGATVCYWRGDIKLLKEDLQLIRPTFFIGVPRVFNRFYNAI